MGVNLVKEQLLLMKTATKRDAQVKKTLFQFHSTIFLTTLIESLFHVTNFPGIANIYNAVDCEWDDWIIGECTESCGGGTRTKHRTEKVSKAYGGAKCEGPDSIEETCNDLACPSNGQPIIVTNLF